MAEGVSVEYVDEYVTEGRFGFMRCSESTCNGSDVIAGSYLDGKITLYKSAFENKITYRSERYENGMQIISTRQISNTGPMGNAVFTFGHEGAHSMGVDMIGNKYHHTEGEVMGLEAYNRFKELYE